MNISEKIEIVADEVYAKAKEDELTEFNGTAMPFPDRMTDPTNIGESFEVITDEVYAKGRDDQWNENWDTYQENGTKTYYYNAFYGSRWNDASFKPKYNIIPTNARAMLHSSKITDLIGILDKQNVVLDLSKATDIRWLAQYSTIKAFGVIDTTSSNLDGGIIIGENYYLTTIEKLILRDDGSQSNINLSWTTKLNDITIEGVAGSNFNCAYCNNLTRECLLGKPATEEQITAGKNLFIVGENVYYGGILGSLKNFIKEGLGNTATLTLGSTAFGRLTETEKAVVQDTLGWSISKI